ncbi:MAG: endolytic transglycosylase MltG [Anaerolineae bacterium]
MKRGIRLMLCCVAALVFLGCGLEELYIDAYIDGKQTELQTPAGDDPTPVVFTIEPGESVPEIAGDLKAKGLISDTELFRRYLQHKGLDDKIQAGAYTLQATMTIPEIVQVFLQASGAEQQVTIPEGKRMEEVAAIVAEQTTMDRDDFLTVAQTGWRSLPIAQDYDFLAQIPVTATLEGFLFPDTYRLALNATPQDLIRRMLDNFERRVTPDIVEGFAQHNLTLYEGIILSSIVEREAVLDNERPIIAGVYHNRLRDGWPLSACPTVQYALGYQTEQGTWWKPTLTYADLELGSPYNTYRHQGLPPGPIANPGLEAIRAAAQPAETEYYFFMVDCERNDGSHLFARTEAEHLANFDRCGGVITAP